MRVQRIMAFAVKAPDLSVLDVRFIRATWPSVRGSLGWFSRRLMSLALQMMSWRICRELMAFLLRGCFANKTQTCVTLMGKPSKMCCRNARAVFLSAAATGSATANLDVRSFPTNRLAFGSEVCPSAMSIRKRPMGLRLNV